ncbi:MAG: glycosyltransferase family 4 protein [Planctomycetota bacterium]
MTIPNRKIKLLYIITRLIKGGATNVVASLCNGLNPDLYEITLVCGKIEKPLGNTLHNNPSELNNKVKLVVLSDLIREIKPIKDILALIKLYRLIKNGNFDIVHTHTSKAGAIGRLAAKLAGVPFVIHSPHGHIFSGNIPNVPKNSFLLKCLLTLERFTALFTDKFITPTYIEKKEELALGIGHHNKFVVIPNGVELNRFENQAIDPIVKRKELGLTPDNKAICTVARLSEEKGIHYLIEALPLIIKEIPLVKLILVGEGPLRKIIEQKAKEKGVFSNVIFLDSSPDIAGILSASDIFVLPSLYEAFGLALVEAMIMRKPIIATRVGGIPEVIKDGWTGVLVSPADSNALAHNILSVLKNKSLQQSLGQSAYQYAKEHFDVEQMVNKTEELYLSDWHRSGGLVF